MKSPAKRKMSPVYSLPNNDIETKRRFIKDPVWGNIELFPWEYPLLNHFILNRLHNIVQNSSAYKVYPGLKYSRLLHSIGVAHVATQLFVNVVANSHGPARVALNDESRKIRKYFDTQALHMMRMALCRSICCPPNFVPMLCAIRASALFHDIGHLPFSHVFENAIEGFCQGVNDELTITPQAEAQRASINKVVYSASKADRLKVHEILGEMLVKTLKDDFGRKPQIKALLEASQALLWTSQFPISRGFLVGTVDADRIDFVRRDGFFSGLFTSAVDSTRLFAFFELGKKTVTKLDGSQTKIWAPRPSPRTSAETEKLLLERFLDYKYIVVHHRVHLYDEIMENLLIRLIADGTLSSFMDDFIKFFTQQEDEDLIAHNATSFRLQSAAVISFDDPWLESVIRQQYARLGDIQDPTTRFLLLAYVEKRDAFKSAFKADQDFHDACTRYAPDLRNRDPLLVRMALAESKYELQNQMGKALEGRVVLVGPTEKKLNYGIKNDSDASFINADGLLQTLTDKKKRSASFNFWYQRKPNDTTTTHSQILQTSLELIQTFVTTKLKPDQKSVAA